MKHNNLPKKSRYTGERLAGDDAYLKPLRIENLQRFKYFLTRFRGGRILDLGCGAAEGSSLLSRNFHNNVYAVDNSLETLKQASKRYDELNINWALADGQNLCFANNSFGGVISIEVIEHLPDPLMYLAETRRVIIPGGIFMLSTPNRLISSPNINMLWPEHIREYSPEELRALLLTQFTHVEILGESIPVYEKNPYRRFMRKLAPWVKPRLPHWLRIRLLPIVQVLIKPELQPEDVVFSNSNIDALPTIIAFCS